MNEFEDALDDGDAQTVKRLHGDAQTVKRLLRENPALLEEPDKYGRRPLMQAVSAIERTLGCVRALLDAGADVNAATREGYTALHCAVHVNTKLVPTAQPHQFIQLLVKAGADVEARQHWDWTPLMRAVLEGSVEETAALLAVGANPDVAFPQNTLPAFLRGRTLLMKAVSDLAKLSLLLNAGADTSLKDEYGQTALGYANGLLAEAVSTEYKAEVSHGIRLLEALTALDK